MSYQIETILPFDKAVKRLVKKYRLIKQDLQVLVGTLSADPSLRQPFDKLRTRLSTSRGGGYSRLCPSGVEDTAGQ